MSESILQSSFIAIVVLRYFWTKKHQIGAKQKTIWINFLSLSLSLSRFKMATIFAYNSNLIGWTWQSLPFFWLLVGGLTFKSFITNCCNRRLFYSLNVAAVASKVSFLTNLCSFLFLFPVFWLKLLFRLPWSNNLSSMFGHTYQMMMMMIVGSHHNYHHKSSSVDMTNEEPKCIENPTIRYNLSFTFRHNLSQIEWKLSRFPSISFIHLILFFKFPLTR